MSKTVKCSLCLSRLVFLEDAALALPPLPPLLFLADDLEAEAALFLGILPVYSRSERFLRRNLSSLTEPPGLTKGRKETTMDRDRDDETDTTAAAVVSRLLASPSLSNLLLSSTSTAELVLA